MTTHARRARGCAGALPVIGRQIRRSALTLVLLGLGSQLVVAQQSRIPQVGVLSPYAAADSSFQDDLRRGLLDLGYIEGKTVAFQFRYAEGRSERLPALARELAQLRVNVIVTTTAPAVRALKDATSSVPIVIGGADDAVEQGFVASLANPGTNVTGTSWLNAELTGKRIDILKQALPALARMAILREAVAGGTAARAAIVAAENLGIRAYIMELRAADELDDAFTEMARLKIGAVSVLEGPMTTSESGRIAKLAARHRLPAIYPNRRFIEAGGLMSYGPNLPTMYRRAAVYVDLILKGANPAELPVEQPTAFELIVSLRAAKLINVDLSGAILARADEIVD